MYLEKEIKMKDIKCPDCNDEGGKMICSSKEPCEGQKDFDPMECMCHMLKLEVNTKCPTCSKWRNSNQVETTEFEKIYLNAIRKSNFYESDEFGVYCFSVVDEIKEFTEQQAKGVLSSLVKKGLVNVYDSQGDNKSKDMCVILTNNGKATCGKLKKE
jgi:hypothetical protein